MKCERCGMEKAYCYIQHTLNYYDVGITKLFEEDHHDKDFNIGDELANFILGADSDSRAVIRHCIKCGYEETIYSD